MSSKKNNTKTTTKSETPVEEKETIVESENTSTMEEGTEITLKEPSIVSGKISIVDKELGSVMVGDFVSREDGKPFIVKNEKHEKLLVLSLTPFIMNVSGTSEYMIAITGDLKIVGRQDSESLNIDLARAKEIGMIK